MKEKLEDSDLTKVNTVLNELDGWLLNEEHSKSDYDNKMNELNGILQPIMMKRHINRALKEHLLMRQYHQVVVCLMALKKVVEEVRVDD